MATVDGLEDTYSVVEDVGSEAPRALAAPSLSHVGGAVLDALSAFPSERNSTWSFRSDASFDSGWVLQTLPYEHWGASVEDLSVPRCTSNCDADFGLQRCETQSDCTGGGTCSAVESSVSRIGDDAARMCVGHSDRFYDELYLAMIEAEELLDVTSLTPADGRFEAAIRNALTYLDSKNRPIRVRLLFGNITSQEIDADEVVASLTRDLPASSKLTINVAGYRKGWTSWNHAKIIAVDGELLVQGGHNLWDLHYLDKAPIHDLSMSVRGSVAADAHRFVNRLWDYACQDPWFWAGWNTRAVFPRRASDCPEAFRPHAAENQTGAHAFALGRLGAIGPDPADAGILAALGAAQHSIKISQQDIGPILVGWITIGDWPEPVLRALGEALMRGVDVDIVLSAPQSLPGDLSFASAQYGNGWTAEDVAERIHDWVREHPEVVPPGTDVRATLCDQLHVTNLRVNDTDELWKDGERMGNHAKFFIVDDVAFYLGSQNLYAADLAELGLLIDDASATADILEAYWEPLWRYSVRAAVTGRDAASCSL